MTFAIHVAGEREAELVLEDLPEKAREVLKPVINELIEELYGQVVGREPVRTGRLRSTTAKAEAQDRGDRVSGRVFIDADFAKAAALEYGAHGTATVRAHMETLGHVFGHLVAPFAVLVAEHSRHVDIAEHEFLRGPLHDIEAQALDRMREALANLVK